MKAENLFLSVLELLPAFGTLKAGYIIYLFKFYKEKLHGKTK